MTFFSELPSPIGTLLLVGDGDQLRGLCMQDGPRPEEVRPDWRRDDAPFAVAREQLTEYFAGTRTEFDLPLHATGTAFKRDVWGALRDIPYGETRSYAEIARAVGRPGEARAVGSANARNPIAVVVPCHRVIGADGSLTGFGGGLERKRLLLEHETGVRQLAI